MPPTASPSLVPPLDRRSPTLAAELKTYVVRHRGTIETMVRGAGPEAGMPAAVRYSKVIDGKLVNVGVRGAAADIAVLLGETPVTIEQKLTGDLRYKVVAKGVTPETWRRRLWRKRSRAST